MGCHLVRRVLWKGYLWCPPELWEVFIWEEGKGRGAFSYDRFSCIFKLQGPQMDMIRSIDFNQLDSIFPISILAQNMNYQINCFHLGPKMCGCELARSANAGNLSFALCGQLCDAVPLSKWHKLFTVISSEKLFIIKMAIILLWLQILVLLRLFSSGETLCRDNCQLIGMPFCHTRSAGKNNRN